MVAIVIFRSLDKPNNLNQVLLLYALVCPIDPDVATVIFISL